MSVTRYVTANVRRESRDPYRTVPNLTGPTSLVAEPASWRWVTYCARFADAMMALTGEVEA